jgi:transposase
MDLTDAQWELLKKYFPKSELKRPGRLGGRPWRCARDVLNGVLWIMRTGSPWKDLPACYPSYQTCHRRLQKWVKSRVFERIIAGLRNQHDKRVGVEKTEAFIDGSYVPAKKKATTLVNVAQEMQQKSWQLQIIEVFRLLSLLQKETVTTALLQI